jgi:outer membrane lipopolysaccharide assembly protein LptE/RlpB
LSFKLRYRFLTRSLPGLLIVAGLCGCGFKLAGTSQLPESLDSLHLITKDFSDQQRDDLSSALKNAGVTLTVIGEGKATLSVTLKKLPQKTVVSSASTGKTIVRLARQLNFSLKLSDETQGVHSKSLVQQQNFELDEDNLLSSSKQKKDVIKDLEVSLYNQLIFQMQRF